MATTDLESAIFPMAVMNITTRMGEGTHIGSYAIDIAGKDKSKEFAFAPFTGTIKKKYSNGNTVWLESNEPVISPDGIVDYLTVAMTHDNNIDDLYVGQVINQGQNFYQEGTAGQATGNHIHLGVGRGKFRGTGWYKNKYGYWVINDEIKPFDAFYLSGTEIINDGGYPWKDLEEKTVYISEEEYKDLQSWKSIGIDAQPYKDGVVNSKAWTADMKTDRSIITPVINDLQQYKIDHPNSSEYIPVTEQLYKEK